MTTKSPTESTDSSYAKAGDVFHYVTIASTLSFALLAGMYMTDHSFPLFDTAWQKEGFCVTNRDVPYKNSHDLCLYADTALALVATVLFFSWRKDPGMERANVIFKSNIPGILLHGVGHGTIARVIRDGSVDVDEGHKVPLDIWKEENDTYLEMAVAMLPLLCFWFFMSKASMPQVSTKLIVGATFLSTLRHMYTPNYFGFTYVQTILLLQFSINQLARPKEEKDFSYFLYPVVVGLPLTLVGWTESTMCSMFVKDLFYGHLAYDAFIPLAMMAWYAIVHNRAASSEKVKKL